MAVAIQGLGHRGGGLPRGARLRGPPRADGHAPSRATRWWRTCSWTWRPRWRRCARSSTAAAQLQDRIVAWSGGKRAARGELAALKRALRDRTPLVKWFGSERALWVTRTAVQVHGGYGVVQDYDVERHYRDALILPIYEGTSQIQALMSLKDQARWVAGAALAAARRARCPWRRRGRPGRRRARHGRRVQPGAALRPGRQPGRGRRALAALRRREPPREDLAYALLHAERLAAMLAYTRAAEALAARAAASAASGAPGRALRAARAAAGAHARRDRAQRGPQHAGVAPPVSRNGARSCSGRPACPGGAAVVAAVRRPVLGKRFARAQPAPARAGHMPPTPACGARRRPSAAAARTSSRSGWATPTRWAAPSCWRRILRHLGAHRGADPDRQPRPSPEPQPGGDVRHRAARPQHRAPARAACTAWWTPRRPLGMSNTGRWSR